MQTTAKERDSLDEPALSSQGPRARDLGYEGTAPDQRGRPGPPGSPHPAQSERLSTLTWKARWPLPLLCPRSCRGAWCSGSQSRTPGGRGPEDTALPPPPPALRSGILATSPLVHTHQPGPHPRVSAAAAPTAQTLSSWMAKGSPLQASAQHHLVTGDLGERSPGLSVKQRACPRLPFLLYHPLWKLSPGARFALSSPPPAHQPPRPLVGPSTRLSGHGKVQPPLPGKVPLRPGTHLQSLL